MTVALSTYAVYSVVMTAIYNREHHYEIDKGTSCEYIAVSLGTDRHELSVHVFGRNGSDMATREWTAKRLWRFRSAARREHGHYRLDSDVVVY